MREFERGREAPSAKCYADVTSMSSSDDWVLNQWMAMGAIMEPVLSQMLNIPLRMIGGKTERRISQHFTRFELAKEAVRPLF